MSETLQQILQLLLPSGIGGLVGWFTARKQKEAQIEAKNAEIASLRADGSKKIMDNYQEALDDLKKRYDERFQYLKEEYEMRHKDLRSDYERKYERLKEDKNGQIEGLNRKVDNLVRNVKTWQEKYRTLKKEFDDYRNRTATGNITSGDGE